MKKQLLTGMMMITAISMFAFSNPVFAQVGDGTWGNGPGEFIDENGDGFNDLAPDADGDGIPNGADEDFVKPQDGSGAGFGAKRGPGDGTGSGQGPKEGRGPGYGRGVGPGDGTGDCITDPEPLKPRYKVALSR